MARGRIHIFRRSELLQTSQALKFRRIDDGDTTRVELDVAEDRIVKHLGLVLWWRRRLGAGALAGGRGHGSRRRRSAAARVRGWCSVDACGCGSTGETGRRCKTSFLQQGSFSAV
jgi:hypothetical protein